MSFLRHVGKHGDRKVAVIFREVPGEPHMCLVAYTELLNQHIHDPMIKCIESDIGQNSENLADALNRSYTKDGNPILQVLHREGQLKKVNTELVIMTPAPNTKIKLNELNKILDQMKMGEDAVRKMAEMDSQMGMQDPMAVARRMRGDKDAFTPETIPGQTAPLQASGDALGDSVIANSLRQQALRMATEAKGLLAESERMLSQAETLAPSTTVAKATGSTLTGKKSRGRPKKTVTV